MRTTACWPRGDDGGDPGRPVRRAGEPQAALGGDACCGRPEPLTGRRQRGAERGRQGRDPDRLRQLLRVEAHGARSTPRSSSTPATRSTATSASGPARSAIPTFEAGQIDLVPEYVGSGPRLLRQDQDHRRRRGQNATALQAVYDAKSKLARSSAITPGQDTNAFVVRKDTADSLKLTKMSDLAAVQDQLKWGLPPDCDTNPLCKGALENYGITYPPKQRQALGACDVPIAQALQGKAIDLAELCSTQPAIAQFGFVALDGRQEDPAGREHRPARPGRLPRQGRHDRVPGAPRRGLRQDDDRRADQARRQGRRRQQRTSRMSPRSG